MEAEMRQALDSSTYKGCIDAAALTVCVFGLFRLW